MDHSILHSLLSPISFLATNDISDFLKNFMAAAWGNVIATAGEAVGKFAIDSLQAVLGYILYIPIVIAYTMTTLSVIALDVSLFTPLKSTTIYDAWEVSIYIVNILAIFIIIFIAFANALRINIETYEIKKTLPNFIIGIILANLSFLICKFLLDFSDVLLYGIKQIFSSTDKSFAAQLMHAALGIKFDQYLDYYGIRIWYPTRQDLLSGVNDILAYLFITPFLTATFLPGLGTAMAPFMALANLVWAIIILSIPALLITILAIICLARNIILYILIAIMPIIIVLYFFPPTKSHGQKLLGEFFQWLFLGPAIYFILGIGTLFKP